ncbi:unnamed protein product [Adineta ricciae]|uniref:Uncharacterized protein n=1 Tax=Adineta ricciae TaxID=249248 RepID=A0A814W7L4_ADIRI|nr:unnamed protein product [Adineta ricciae]
MQSCFIFLLSRSIVNSQICDNTIPYRRCSSNSVCKYYPMAGANDVSVCTFILKQCSQLIPCGSSQECSHPDSFCIHHNGCGNSPVCYPLSMINENICPPLLAALKCCAKKLKVCLSVLSNQKSAFLKSMKLIDRP